MRASSMRFADGRLHLQHGPIDCIVEATGERDEVDTAYAQVIRRFEDVLPALAGELPILRSPVRAAYPLVRGPVAKRMVAAVWPHREVFVTPMAAVAGAVADELLAALVRGRTVHKAYVNDGGDIALHLDGYAEFDVGIAGNPAMAMLDGSLKISSASTVRGIATSGWRGRSQSLGIADAVTVLAETAAAADAAATMIANAVNVDHPAIRRLPAREVKEDSDLGDLPVTVEVGALPPSAVEEALDAGTRTARDLHSRGLVVDAYLSLNGMWRTALGSAAHQLRARC
ncbi:MAG: UPF0280 family protein [Proteobacteria bacterium]|nr:UPF0280 family protein [Pseudomonadota bacterium]